MECDENGNCGERERGREVEWEVVIVYYFMWDPEIILLKS